MTSIRRTKATKKIRRSWKVLVGKGNDMHWFTRPTVVQCRIWTVPPVIHPCGYQRCHPHRYSSTRPQLSLSAFHSKYLHRESAHDQGHRSDPFQLPKQLNPRLWPYLDLENYLRSRLMRAKSFLRGAAVEGFEGSLRPRGSWGSCSGEIGKVLRQYVQYDR